MARWLVAVAWAAALADVDGESTLLAGETLDAPGSLNSDAAGEATATTIIQTDGNLVIEDPLTASTQPHHAGHSIARI